MKQRTRKFLAGLLSFGMLLQAASPLSALAASARSGSAPTLTVAIGSQTFTLSPSEDGKAEADKPDEWKEAVGGISSIDYADGTYTFHYGIETNGKDIKITGSGSPSIVMDVDDTAVNGNLTVTDVADVVLTKSRLNMDPVVIGNVDINCTGDVRIKNNCTNYTTSQQMQAVSGSLNVTTHGDVKIRGMVNSSINGDVVIDTTGVVELSSPNGPVSGKGLTVKNASYVGVSSRKGIFYSKSDLALENCTLVELKDDYANVLGQTYDVTISPDGYQLYAGYNESSAAEKESLDNCRDAHYIRIETGTQPQAKPAASLTILDEFSSYYTTVTYILNRYEDGSVSWKNGQDPWNGAVDVKYDTEAKTFVFTGTLSELAESNEDRVTMICSDKEDSIQINGNVSAATLSLGVGTDTIGAKNLTIQSNSTEPAVRETITLNCSGDVSITNPSGAITGNKAYNSGVYCYGVSQNFTLTGSSTDPLTGDGLRLYAKESVTVENLSGPVAGRSISVEENGSTAVKITGNSSKGLMQSTSASAEIAAASLTMENKSGPVGSVKFTRTDTTSDYRVAVGESASKNTQASMDGTTYEQTVSEKYLNIQPGTPENTKSDAELEVTLTPMSGAPVTQQINPQTPSITFGETTINVDYDDNGTYTLSGTEIGSYDTGSSATDVITISGVNSGKDSANVKLAITIHGNLVVKDIHDLEVTKRVSVQNSVTCTGNVTMTADMLAQSGLIVNAGGDVTLTGTGASITICKNGTTDWGAEITSGGNVVVENISGSIYGTPVSGGILVHDAKNVTIKSSSQFDLIRGSEKADITADTLTIIGTNSNVGGPVTFTRRNSGSIDDYVIGTGDSADAENYKAVKLESKAYTVDAKYLYIGPGDVTPVQPTSYGFTVNGVAITSDNLTSALPDGLTYDPSTNKLTATKNLTGGLTIMAETNSTLDVVLKSINGGLTIGAYGDDKNNTRAQKVTIDGTVTGLTEVYTTGDIKVNGTIASEMMGNSGLNRLDTTTGKITVTSDGAVWGQYATFVLKAVSGPVKVSGNKPGELLFVNGPTIFATEVEISNPDGKIPAIFFAPQLTGDYYINNSAEPAERQTFSYGERIISEAVDSKLVINQTKGTAPVEPEEPETPKELEITVNGNTYKFGKDATHAALDGVSGVTVTYFANGDYYKIDGGFNSAVTISGTNNETPNVKMENSNGQITSGNLTVTGVNNFEASSISEIADSTLSVTAKGEVKLSGKFKNTVVKADSLTMESTNGTLGNVSFTGSNGKTYVATTDDGTIDVPQGDTVNSGYLHIGKGTEPDQPGGDDIIDTDTSSGGSGAGAVAAGVAIGGVALFVGYEVTTDIMLRGMLPEGADIPVNRGQLAWLIWGAKGAPLPVNQPAFTDVSEPEMALAAQWCVEQGILDAKSDTTFKPNGWVTRIKVIETWNKAFPKQ